MSIRVCKTKDVGIKIAQLLRLWRLGLERDRRRADRLVDLQRKELEALGMPAKGKR